jgi:hypothetical protein
MGSPANHGMPGVARLCLKKSSNTQWQIDCNIVVPSRFLRPFVTMGQLGTVEVGKLADLIVVGANPLEDITTNVRRLQLVLKEGRAVSDKRHPHGAAP